VIHSVAPGITTLVSIHAIAHTHDGSRDEHTCAEAHENDVHPFLDARCGHEQTSH
jgi:hypothetical protein